VYPRRLCLRAKWVQIPHTAREFCKSLTRKEFTSFTADAAQDSEARRIIVLRCEDVPLRGLFAPTVYQDLVGVTDPAERRRRILSAVEDQSQTNRPPPRAFVGVPPRITNFTGRAKVLDRLNAIFFGDVRPAGASEIGIGRAAAHGMGGIGKTSLAVEYAHRFRDLYAGVWWCHAETRNELIRSLAKLGNEIGVAVPPGVTQPRPTELLSQSPAAPSQTTGALAPDAEKQARAVLRWLSERRTTWLLVYDNVTTPDDVTDLFPDGGAKNINYVPLFRLG
jgi:hypothetical protein